MDEVDIIIEALDIKRYKGTLIDVGAHHGSTSIHFVRCGWDVYAFEPDSRNREWLIKRLGKYQNVTIDKRAISNVNQDALEFYRSDQSSGISGLSAFHPTHKISEKVSVATLSTIIGQYKISNIDFLKIDTEGFDMHVLEGMPWEKFHPRVILCEFENNKSLALGYDFNDLAEYLHSKGYKILVSEWLPIVNYGIEHTWFDFKLYPCNLNNDSAWGNLIASNDGDTFDLITHIAKKYKSVMTNQGGKI
jgi:FkbM family methyltransferase